MPGASGAVQPGLQPRILRLDDIAAARIFALAEIQRKGQLLLIGDILVAEQQHRVFIHAGLDVGGFLRRQRLSQIDAGNLAEKMLVQLANGHGHERLPDRSERLLRSI